MISEEFVESSLKGDTLMTPYGKIAWARFTKQQKAEVHRLANQIHLQPNDGTRTPFKAVVKAAGDVIVPQLKRKWELGE